MIILVLGLLGLCLGSFINALVWRVHEQAARTSKRARAELSITKGRSMCTHCHQTLGFGDLIPVFSWLFLRGKCRYCQKPIQDTPFTELLTPVVFAVSYWYWPFGWARLSVFQFAVWLLVVTGCIALAVYDARWQLLPNRIVYPLGALVLLQVVVLTIGHRDWRVATGAALATLCLGGLFYALFQVSDGRWIGGGDVRLGVVIGLLLASPVQAVLVLFLASLMGTLVSLPLLITKRPQLTRKVAFGPFLIVATAIVYLFGGSLVHYYKTRFLLL